MSVGSVIIGSVGRRSGVGEAVSEWLVVGGSVVSGFNKTQIFWSNLNRTSSVAASN